MKQAVVTAALGLLLHVALANASSWTYSGATGPANWKDSYPKCDDQSQSPIDITTTTYQDLGAFTFTNYNTPPTTLQIENNGHAIAVNPSGTTMTVSGGGLAGARKVVGFHFHHGSTDTQGSEHTVNGVKYPMEMHIVHQDPSLTLANAITTPQGLAVLGMFFEVQAANNTDLDNIVSKLPDIVASGATASITPFRLDLLLPSDRTAFYRYNGSLTTPSCDESVEWTVFRETLKASSVQLAEFRKVQFTDGSAMVDNFRPVQALNGRTVYSTFSSAGTPKPVIFLISLVTVVTSVFHRV